MNAQNIPKSYKLNLVKKQSFKIILLTLKMIDQCARAMDHQFYFEEKVLITIIRALKDWNTGIRKFLPTTLVNPFLVNHWITWSGFHFITFGSLIVLDWIRVLRFSFWFFSEPNSDKRIGAVAVGPCDWLSGTLCPVGNNSSVEVWLLHRKSENYRNASIF